MKIANVIGKAAISAVLAISILALAAGWSRNRFGSISAALDYLNGEHLVVDGRSKDLGIVGPGADVVLQYRLTNMTGHPVRVTGARTSCSCTVIAELPMTLAMGESRSIRLRISAPNQGSRFNGTIELYTDDPGYRDIILAYAGTLASADRVHASDAR